MKRITNKKANKKGFTLTELILVIAIIVIMVGAVSVGIVIDLNRYNEYLDSLTDEDGNSVWERGALNAVRGIFGPGPVLPNVTLAPTPIPTAEATATATASATAAATASAKPTTTAPTSAPPTTPPTAPPTTTPTDPPSSGGSALAGSSVNKSNTWDNGTKHEVHISLPSSSNSFVVYIPGDPDEINTYNNASVTSLGNNQYRLTYGWGLNSTGFQVYGVSESDISKMYVVSQG